MSSLLSRRGALKHAGAAAALFLDWHVRQASAGGRADGVIEDRPCFSMLRLKATRLEEMRTFYGKTFGLPIEGKAKESFRVQCGATVIEFAAAHDSDPFYHFAFNIPENKIAAAKTWLAKRCELLRDSTTGADEVHFENWNAHAVYFRDPAGNIGELIARHSLLNAKEGDFDEHDILYASEIGLVSGDPVSLAADVEARFGMRPYLGNSTFLGDERGLLILPPTGRPWIPERRQKAQAFAAEVEMNGEPVVEEYRLTGLPYVLRRGSAAP